MIQTGVGPIPVHRPMSLPRTRSGVRDREPGAAEPARFGSAILPKWPRRTLSPDAPLPVLCLRGVSTGDVQEALAALLGQDAPNLSPFVAGRPKETWQREYGRRQLRDLSELRYIWPTVPTFRPARSPRPSACRS